MRKLLREPLAHFLLLGAALFGIYALVGDRASDRSGEIVVTRGQVEQLVLGFSRTWQRPPTQQELKGLVEDYIREEVLYREAVAMGLDRDDTIVRRRMRQKLEFLTEDGASQAAPPTEAELEAYLQQHADHFREQPRLSFEHILFSRQRRGKSAEADARATLARLKGRSGSAIDTEGLGDAFLLPFHYQRSSTEEITQLFERASGSRWPRLSQASGRGRSRPATDCTWCGFTRRFPARSRSWLRSAKRWSGTCFSYDANKRWRPPTSACASDTP
jgi:hypothetical protein